MTRLCSAATGRLIVQVPHAFSQTNQEMSPVQSIAYAGQPWPRPRSQERR